MDAGCHISGCLCLTAALCLAPPFLAVDAVEWSFVSHGGPHSALTLETQVKPGKVDEARAAVTGSLYDTRKWCSVLESESEAPSTETCVRKAWPLGPGVLRRSDLWEASCLQVSGTVSSKRMLEFQPFSL